MSDNPKVHPEPQGSARGSAVLPGAQPASPARPAGVLPGPDTPQQHGAPSNGFAGLPGSTGEEELSAVSLSPEPAHPEGAGTRPPAASTSAAAPSGAAPPAGAAAVSPAEASGAGAGKRPAQLHMSMVAKQVMGNVASVTSPNAAHNMMRARQFDQAMEAFTRKTNQRNAFVSYSRRNKIFVEGLVRALRGLNLTLWIDYEDIPVGVDWRAMIKAGVQCSENVIFILSPDWIASDECRKELELAIEQNKRLVPVLYQPCQHKDIPKELQEINWIYARDEDDLDIAVGQIVAACQSDAEYIKVLTRIATGCAQWMEEKENATLLISNEREVELAASTIQLALTTDKKPKPTADAIRYVELSRQRVRQREKRNMTIVLSLAILSVFLLIAACGIVGWAVVLKGQADSSASAAIVARAAAEVNLEKANNATALAQANLEIANNATAAAKAAKAIAEAKTIEAEANLQVAKNATAAAQKSEEAAKASEANAKVSEANTRVALNINTARSLASAGQAYASSWADLALLYALQGVRQAFNLTTKSVMTQRYTVNTLRQLLAQTGGVSLRRDTSLMTSACPNTTWDVTGNPQKVSIAADGSELVVAWSDSTVIRWKNLNSIAGAKSYSVDAEVLKCPPSGKTPSAVLQLAYSASRKYFVLLACTTGTCSDDGSSTQSNFVTTTAYVINAVTKTKLAEASYTGKAIGFAWNDKDVLLMQDNSRMTAFGPGNVSPTLEASQVDTANTTSRATIWTCVGGSIFVSVKPGLGDQDTLAFTMYNLTGQSPSTVSSSPKSTFERMTISPAWSVKVKDIQSTSVQLRERDCGVLMVAVSSGAGASLALHSVAINVNVATGGDGVLSYSFIMTGTGDNPYTPLSVAFGPERSSNNEPPFTAFGTSSGALALMSTYRRNNTPIVTFSDAGRVPVPGITLDMTNVVNLVRFPSENCLLWADGFGAVYSANAGELLNPGLAGLPVRMVRHGKRLYALDADSNANFIASASSDGSVGLWRQLDTSWQTKRSRLFLTTGEPFRLLTSFVDEILGASSMAFFKDDSWLVATVNSDMNVYDMAIAGSRFASDGTNLNTDASFTIELTTPCTGKTAWAAPHPDASLGVFAVWCVGTASGDASQVSIVQLPTAGNAANYGLINGKLRPVVTYTTLFSAANFVDGVSFTLDGQFFMIGTNVYAVTAASGVPSTSVSLDLAAVFASAVSAGRLTSSLGSTIIAVYAAAGSRLLFVVDSQGNLVGFRRELSGSTTVVVFYLPGLDVSYRTTTVVVGVSGKYVAVATPPQTSSTDYTGIYLWSVATLLATSDVVRLKEYSIPFSAKCPAVKAVLFSPDGNWLVTDDAVTNKMCLFNTASAATPSSWTQYSSITMGYLSYGRQFAKFNPASSLLLTESTVLPGAQAFVLDANSTGSPLDEPWLLRGPVDLRGAAFSNSGGNVAVLSVRGRTLRVHEMSASALVTRACAMVKRSLTESEFTQVVSDSSSGTAYSYADTCPTTPWLAQLSGS